MRGIVIGGTHSGSGKTTMTLGLLAALKKRDYVAQAFKTGPDFIDSGLHRLITGRPSRNLDLWMCGPAYVKEGFLRHSAGADISVIEGVMGLFDGRLSTASLAASLDLPIVLVVDGYGMAETAGALIRGFAVQAAEAGVLLAGVIFNRVASETHFERLQAPLSGIKVLGYLPRDLTFEIPHRHLGLTVMEEDPITKENLDRLADAVLEHIDIDMFFDMAEGMGIDRSKSGWARREPLYLAGVPIVAVAYDKAFTFYYEDNLDLLREAGAKIIRFSPLTDKAIPSIADAVYLGGGYPELHAGELSANSAMRMSIRDWAEAGKPLYGECGGLMYLSRGIYDFDGNYFDMAGVFPFETRMKKGRSSLGYRKVVLKEDCLLGKLGDEVRGHEFHYSEIVEKKGKMQPVKELYMVQNGNDEDLPDEGYSYKNTFGSYIHLHFGSNSRIAETLVKHAREKEK